MPVSISLSRLAWATPDGRPLFADLDLSFGAERTGLVGRNGVGKSTLLKLISGALVPAAGRVTVSGRLAVLSQAVQLRAHERVADLFGVGPAFDLIQRAERGIATANEVAQADWTLEARIAEAMGRLALDANADTLLAALSGGQRTRAALAALVFASPDIILLDEPTNNLDRDGRASVIALLATWHTGAIVVSHDRELLDTMDAIVELTSLGATRYGGNWTDYREQRAVALAAAHHDLAHARRRIADVDVKTQETAERKARKDSTGRKNGAKGGTPRILLGMRKNRSENTSGDQARLAERRRAQATADAANARARIEVLQPLGIALPRVELPARKVVLEIERATAGYESDRPILRDVSLSIVGPERVAITGPNGSGKTTLLSMASGVLAPVSGSVQRFVPFAMLDQRVGLLDAQATIRDNFRRLHPDTDENACRAALAQFLFRADAALQVVSTLSGGELLRAGLACVLGGTTPPALLMLDEPTNHLDIDSIESLEAALRAYAGALLVVSHDDTFLRTIGITRRITLPASAPESSSIHSLPDPESLHPHCRIERLAPG